MKAGEQINKEQLDAQEKTIGLELKANDADGAWQTYRDFRNSGGEKISASVWLDPCRQLKTQTDQDRAARVYEELAHAYSTEKQRLLAQTAVERIYLKRLHRPEDAPRFYQAAQASSVPHGEWQTTINCGIAEAKKLPQPQTAPVTTRQ